MFHLPAYVAVLVSLCVLALSRSITRFNPTVSSVASLITSHRLATCPSVRERDVHQHRLAPSSLFCLHQRQPFVRSADFDELLPSAFLSVFH